MLFRLLQNALHAPLQSYRGVKGLQHSHRHPLACWLLLSLMSGCPLSSVWATPLHPSTGIGIGPQRKYILGFSVLNSGKLNWHSGLSFHTRPLCLLLGTKAPKVGLRIKLDLNPGKEKVWWETHFNDTSHIWQRNTKERHPVHSCDYCSKAATSMYIHMRCHSSHTVLFLKWELIRNDYFKPHTYARWQLFFWSFIYFYFRHMSVLPACI